MRYGGFELTYGAAVLALGIFLFNYARWVPETLRRKRQEPALDLFR